MALLRSVGVACLPLLTRHDYLQKNLYRIGVKGSACCPLFHQGDMDDDYLRCYPVGLKFLEDFRLKIPYTLYTGVQKLRRSRKISISAERRGRADRKTNQEIK
ncbi:hypothetical protein TNCV_1733621 [Trichonephila clavipes]|nr:hypothetical protein TNCV_1733621 [Trichonephila clavipes]